MAGDSVETHPPLGQRMLWLLKHNITGWVIGLAASLLIFFIERAEKEHGHH